MNINCVICSDTFLPSDNVFTTPCGHIFHHVCLVQWMERKKDCPQCRSKCTERSIVRLYFNNIVNLDTSQTNSANLIETVDNLTLQVREKDLKLKRFEREQSELELTVSKKEKQIKKLDALAAQHNQIIATMKHEIDLLSSSRASFKIIENENAELRSKLELMQSVESVLSASQKDVDEVLKQNLTVKHLSVMVGTLKRELHANEIRKHELRKQLQSVRNDLRTEQEEKRKLQEKISFYESENHTLNNRIRKIEARSDVESMDISDTPEMIKRPRLALCHLDDQNTPSPLSRTEFEGRIKQIQDSESPYLKVKASSIGLAMLKKPIATASKQLNPSLSIFQKPRINFDGIKKTENLVFNGVGGTSKILQSDLLKPSTVLTYPKKPTFKKNLSASALGK